MAIAILVLVGLLVIIGATGITMAFIVWRHLLEALDYLSTLEGDTRDIKTSSEQIEEVLAHQGRRSLR